MQDVCRREGGRRYDRDGGGAVKLPIDATERATVLGADEAMGRRQPEGGSERLGWPGLGKAIEGGRAAAKEARYFERKIGL